jgi:YfiH family protein
VTWPGRLDEIPVLADLPLFEVPGWESSYGVTAGVTGRGRPNAPFDLALGQEDPVPDVAARWLAVLAQFPGFKGVTAGRQVHGTRIAWHGAVQGLDVRPSTVGHATATPGVLLAVTAADCVPVYVIDPVRRAAALLHAGWRGTRGGILAAGVQALAAGAGSRPRDILIHCGVGICGDCYQVGPEVLDAFGETGGADGRGQLDLRKVLLAQARNLGVGEATASGRCTAHEPDRFFSHRASHGGPGRMAAYLGFAG